MGMAQQPPNRARVQPAPACGQENGVVRARRELRPTGPEVARELQRGLLSERDDSLLSALAAHVDDLALEVDIREVERHGLLAAPSGRVQELEQSSVAQRERRLAVEELEEVVDLGRLGRVREPACAPRRE